MPDKIKAEENSIIARLWRAITKKSDDPDKVTYRITEQGEDAVKEKIKRDEKSQ